jgi:hypothetical protein
MASISAVLLQNRFGRRFIFAPLAAGALTLVGVLQVAVFADGADGGDPPLSQLPAGAVSQFGAKTVRLRSELPNKWDVFSADAALLRTRYGVWDVEAGKRVVNYEELDDRDRVEFPKDGGAFISAPRRDRVVRHLLGKSSLVKEEDTAIPDGAFRVYFADELLLEPLGDGRTVEAWNSITHRRVAIATSAELFHQVTRGASPFFASLDMKLLAAPSPEFGLVVWNLETGRIAVATARVDPSHWRPMLAFSPDGSRMAIPADRGTTVVVFDSATAAILATLPFERDSLGQAAEQFYVFSPNGASIYFGPRDLGASHGAVSQYEIPSGRRMAHIPIRNSDDLAQFAMSLEGAFLRDFGPKSKSVFLDPRPVVPLKRVVVSQDGRLVASCGRDKGVSLWEACSRSRIADFHPNPGSPSVEPVDPLFSPDDRRLVTHLGISPDNGAVVWDTTFGARSEAVHPDDISRLWGHLATRDAQAARKSIWQIASLGDGAVTFVDAQLRPVAIDAGAVKNLIGALDSAEYAVRHDAYIRLEALGRAARPALAARSKEKPSFETRTLITELIANYDGPITDTNLLQSVRAIEALEHIGTAASRRTLGRIAAGADGAIQTVAARAAIRRLQAETPTGH